MWRDFIRVMLVKLGAIPRPDFVTRIVKQHPTPEQLIPGIVVVVQDGKLQKWACFRCPGGCGEKLQLSLNQARRPAWKVRKDFLYRPSLFPSIRQLNDCGCHFWLRSGLIEWCPDSEPNKFPSLKFRMIDSNS